jgi:outer membrane protein OmpA-like peptidoglycan-associated protein
MNDSLYSRGNAANENCSIILKPLNVEISVREGSTMTLNSSACLVCLVLIMTVFCAAVPGVAMENKSSMPSEVDKCSAAKGKYNEGVKLLNYETRRAAFQKAVELCPSYAEAHVNLADALEHLGLMTKQNFKGVQEANKLLDEAIHHYNKAIELKPDLVAARLGLADVFMAQGRYPLAAENYRKALNSQPRFQGLETRLHEAERRASLVTEGVKKASEIASQAQKSNLQSMFKTMGFEDYVIKDSDRQSFNNILFEGWSSAIRPGEPINQLNEIGKALSSKEMSSYKFIIEGHANAVGEFDRNMNLSNERANAVKEYLSKNFGIDKDRMTTQGFGYTRPKHNPPTDAMNRRVEIVFFDEGNKK